MTLLIEAESRLLIEVDLTTEIVSIKQAGSNQPGLLKVLGPGKAKRLVGLAESAEINCAWSPTVTARLVKALREGAALVRLEFDVVDNSVRRCIDVRTTNLQDALQAEHEVDEEEARAAIAAAGFKVNSLQEALRSCYVSNGPGSADNGPRMGVLRHWGSSRSAVRDVQGIDGANGGERPIDAERGGASLFKG